MSSAGSARSLAAGSTSCQEGGLLGESKKCGRLIQLDHLNAPDISRITGLNMEWKCFLVGYCVPFSRYFWRAHLLFAHLQAWSPQC